MQAFMDGFKPAEGGPHSDVPWWMRYAGKGAGVVGGGLAVFFGLSAAVSINPFCIVAGLWEIVAGILVISIEAPFCCVFLDFVQKFSTFMDVRPLWQKAAVYLGLSFPGILLCTSFSSIVASVAIFVCAVLFGMQFLGKKGNQADMAAMAQQDETGMNAADDSAILDKDQYGQMQYP
ncbi:calcium channel flower-like isoform X2 [Tigriopus californicus]|uniref:calcium channel flower-like isoform X2 n=1 Tax=Tigriopus californicus TaxID=6832 RepID=UPI0027DA9B8B|nr:calcium channel flower-like isoform X2 [Tigriopus californicus]